VGCRGTNYYCCVMLPPYENGVLPRGVHWATWEDITERFGTTAHRRTLLDGLREALAILGAAGCRVAYVDGSFVTDKEVPNDFDACWDTTGVDLAALDPVFKELAAPRAAQEARFGGDLFPDVVGGRERTAVLGVSSNGSAQEEQKGSWPSTRGA
jgi:hypothetical protein